MKTINELEIGIPVKTRKESKCNFWRFKGSPTVHPYFGCQIVLKDITLLWINWSFKDKYAKNITILASGQFRGLFIWDSAHVSRLRSVCKYLQPFQSILWFSFTSWTKGSGVGVMGYSKG
jgi:hypothetical protein